LIRSLPGVGERTAAVLAAYLPASFAGWGTHKKITARLQAYIGMDPRLRQSGQWTGNIKLSKRGIGPARTALFQSAFCSRPKDPQMKAYYRALRARGKTHKHAMIDLMRKQLRRLVAVLLTHQPFIPQTLLPA
jgi:transposase